MKVKVTFICENNADASILGEHPNEQLEIGYKLFASVMSSLSDDKMTFHSAEILEEEGEE